MNWDSAQEGELTLECTIFVPYQLENFVVITTGSATTGNVTWSEVEDNSSNLVIPISIGVVLAIVLFVIVARSRMKMEIMKEHLSSISVSLTEETDEDSDEEKGTIECILHSGTNYSSNPQVHYLSIDNFLNSALSPNCGI